jgi:hypothetical protein
LLPLLGTCFAPDSARAFALIRSLAQSLRAQGCKHKVRTCFSCFCFIFLFLLAAGGHVVAQLPRRRCELHCAFERCARHACATCVRDMRNTRGARRARTHATRSAFQAATAQHFATPRRTTCKYNIREQRGPKNTTLIFVWQRCGKKYFI